MDSALDGVKVLDLTHHIAGPYCTKLLADFGAEVTKIERPGSGDPARRMGPFFHDEPHPEKSLLFLYLNTNKRSLTLDLKSEAGRKIVRKLAAEVDLLVENFSPRVLPSLGLSYDQLKELNPRLVVTSISNFGQTGPYRDYKATDIVEYALGGLMYVFGSSDREPLKHALHQAQFRAGTNAAVAATMALYRQGTSGMGQWLDISIQECIAACLRDVTALYTYMGVIRGRQPEDGGDNLRSPIKVRDGYVVPVSYGAVDWNDVADLLDAPELRDARFSTAQGRLEHGEEIGHILASSFSGRDKLELFHAAHRHRGLIYGVVQSPEDVLNSPQYRARDYFAEISHPSTGPVIYPGPPLTMSRTPWRVRSPAPTLGQHNREILCEGLGYSSRELEPPRASGVI